MGEKGQLRSGLEASESWRCSGVGEMGGCSPPPSRCPLFVLGGGVWWYHSVVEEVRMDAAMAVEDCATIVADTWSWRKHLPVVLLSADLAG